MVWEVSRFRLKAPPVISSSCVSPLTSSGRRRASWASQPQKSATLSPQPGGKPQKFIRTCGGTGGGGEKKNYFFYRAVYEVMLEKYGTARQFNTTQERFELHVGKLKQEQ